MNQQFQIRATEDDEMWELWCNTHLFAVIHSDFFSFEIMSYLETKRSEGDLVTEMQLEIADDVFASTVAQ